MRERVGVCVCMCVCVCVCYCMVLGQASVRLVCVGSRFVLHWCVCMHIDDDGMQVCRCLNLGCGHGSVK